MYGKSLADRLVDIENMLAGHIDGLIHRPGMYVGQDALNESTEAWLVMCIGLREQLRGRPVPRFRDWCRERYPEYCAGPVHSGPAAHVAERGFDLSDWEAEWSAYLAWVDEKANSFVHLMERGVSAVLTEPGVIKAIAEGVVKEFKAAEMEATLEKMGEPDD